MSTNKSTSRIRAFQIGAVDAVLTLFGLICLGFGVAYLGFDNLPAAATALGAGLVFLLAATIDRFESLKGLGMEAKTRKLDATINKAEVALSQFKDLTEIVAGNVITLQSKIGRFATTPTSIESQEIANSVRSMLISVGSTDQTVRKALLPWATVMAQDLVRFTLKDAEAVLKGHIAAIEKRLSSATSDEARVMVQQKNQLHTYVSERTKYMSEWPSDEWTSRVKSLLREMPALTEAERVKIDSDFANVLEQVNWLFEKLDYKDLDIWRELDRKKAQAGW